MNPEQRLKNEGWAPQRAQSFAARLDGLNPRQQNAAISKALAKPMKRHTSLPVESHQERLHRFVDTLHAQNPVGISKARAYNDAARDKDGKFASVDSLGYGQVQNAMRAKTTNRAVFASDAADDLTQDAFLRGLEAGNTDKNYVIRAGQNKLIDDRRKDQRVQTQLGHVGSLEQAQEQNTHGEVQARQEERSAEDQVIDQELDKKLLEAFQSLNELQQTVIKLVDLEGHTQQSAADQLGIPLGTVQSSLGRGRKALKDALTPKQSAFTAFPTTAFTDMPAAQSAFTDMPRKEAFTDMPAESVKAFTDMPRSAFTATPQQEHRQAFTAMPEDTMAETTRPSEEELDQAAFREAVEEDRRFSEARHEWKITPIVNKPRKPLPNAVPPPPLGIDPNSILSRQRDWTTELTPDSSDAMSDEELKELVSEPSEAGLVTVRQGATPLARRAELRAQAAEIDAMPFGPPRNKARTEFFAQNPDARKHGVIIKHYTDSESFLATWRRY